MIAVRRRKASVLRVVCASLLLSVCFLPGAVASRARWSGGTETEEKSSPVEELKQSQQTAPAHPERRRHEAGGPEPSLCHHKGAIHPGRKAPLGRADHLIHLFDLRNGIGVPLLI